METGDERGRGSRGARPGMAEAAAGAGRQRRLGGGKARCPPRRLGLPVSQRLLSRPRRYRRGGDGDGPGQKRGIATWLYKDAIARGAEWVDGLQSRNGGWGAFDADNSYYYLNNIPFADHGALLDPPTEDVSGRCVGMIAQLGGDRRQRLKAGRGLSDPHPDARRLLVRPLGRQLHLWHLVGAGGAEWRGPGAGSRHHEARRRLAGRDPESRWRLGRELRQLQAGLQRL